MELYVKKLQ